MSVRSTLYNLVVWLSVSPLRDSLSSSSFTALLPWFTDEICLLEDQCSDAGNESGRNQRDDDGGPGANDRGSPHKKEIEIKQHKEM